MKNILVLAHDDAGQESRIQVALDLTRAVGGHLICLDVVEFPVMGGNDLVFEPGQSILLEDERAREAANRTRLSERLAREDVPWEIRETTGNLADSIIENSGLADLIVVNRQLDDVFAPAMRSVASTIVLEAHKSVVAVPGDCSRFDAFGDALLAWDGSVSAMTALTETLPLLALARSVAVYEVDDPDCVASAEEASAYLSRHEIAATVHRVKPAGVSTADTILSALALNKSAYCVMGAYGHSRLRESLFGGTTREMLERCPVPLIIAH